MRLISTPVYYEMAKHSSQVFVGAVCPYPVEEGILCLFVLKTWRKDAPLLYVYILPIMMVLVLMEPFQ